VSAPFHARFILAPTAATKCRGLQVASMVCSSLCKAAGISSKPLQRRSGEVML
jgi:hypothetical protein